MTSVNNVQLTPKVEELFSKLVRELDVDALAAFREEEDGSVILLQVESGDRRYRLLCSASSHEINLSPREQEIVRLIARGLSNKAVAAVLDISPATVATHLRRIFSKLDVTSRAEMVACVYKAGLFETESSHS
jgi:DNA-binding NarL/FixJ family response regulator